MCYVQGGASVIWSLYQGVVVGLFGAGLTADEVEDRGERRRRGVAAAIGVFVADL